MRSAIPRSIVALTRHSAVRFLVVGGLSAATDTGALFVFHGVAGIWLPLATALAQTVAFVVNFGLNRLWAFENSATAGAHGIGTQLWRYIALSLANLVANVVLVPALTWAGLPYLVAKVVTIGILAVTNYFVSRKWIFASVEDPKVTDGVGSGPDVTRTGEPAGEDNLYSAR